MLGLCCCMGFFCNCGEWGLLSSCGAWVLILVVSLVAENQLWGTRASVVELWRVGAVVVASRL